MGGICGWMLLERTGMNWTSCRELCIDVAVSVQNGRTRSTEMSVAKRVAPHVLDRSSRSKWLGTNVYGHFLVPRRPGFDLNRANEFERYAFEFGAWLCSKETSKTASRRTARCEK